MAKFYFTRTGKPNPFASRWLVSGLIEADDLAGAMAKLDAALAETKITDRSSSFSFADIATAATNPNGLIAITIGER